MPERVLLALIVVIAILGTVPAVAEAVPYAGLALVVLGLVAGFMGGDKADVRERTVIYVVAAGLPIVSDSLDAIAVVGPWVNSVLDGVATGVQGMAVAFVLMQLKTRIMPAG